MSIFFWIDLVFVFMIFGVHDRSAVLFIRHLLFFSTGDSQPVESTIYVCNVMNGYFKQYLLLLYTPYYTIRKLPF